MAKNNGVKLTGHEIRQLSAQGCVSLGSVRRIYAGEPVYSTTAARVVNAARDLGLPQPHVVIAKKSSK